MTQKSQTGNPLTNNGCGGDPPAIFLLARIHMESTRGEWLEVGSEMKGTALYLTNKGSDTITSFYDAKRTSLFPSYSMIYAGGTETTGSKQVSCSSRLTLASNWERKKTTVEAYDKMFRRKNTECVNRTWRCGG